MCWCASKKKASHFTSKEIQEFESDYLISNTKLIKSISFGEAKWEKTNSGKSELYKEMAREMITQLKIVYIKNFMKTDFFPAEIRHNIYIGSIGAAFSKATLQFLGITHIFCCLEKLLDPFPKVAPSFNSSELIPFLLNSLDSFLSFVILARCVSLIVFVFVGFNSRDLYGGRPVHSLVCVFAEIRYKCEGLRIHQYTIGGQ